MTTRPNATYSAFSGGHLIAAGQLAAVAVAAAAAQAAGAYDVLVFSDLDGEQVDLDLRGGEDAIAARYAANETGGGLPARGRGRPKLGVVSREVTLLPDQWEWLSSQPGGASVALRKLVQEARRAGTSRERLRRAHERTYKVMSALAGNAPGFEEAARALFANEAAALQANMRGWPADVMEQVLRLANPDYDGVRAE